MKQKQWDKKDLKLAFEAISAAMRDNPKATHSHIAQGLNAVGIKHPNKDTWTLTEVSNCLISARRLRTRKPSAPEHRTARADDRLELTELILSSQVDGAKKLRLIQALYT